MATPQGAELRHLGTEDGGGDGADTWYRAQNPVAPRMLGVVDDDGADRGLELADLPIDIADQPLECLDGLRRVVLLFGVAEGRLGLDQLCSRPGEVAEAELGAAARRRDVRVHHLAEARQHDRIDGVGLRQLAEGLGEAPGLQRADHRDPEAGVVEAPVHIPVIAARGLHNDELDLRLVQHLAKAPAATGVVPELSRLARRGDADVEVGLADINAGDYLFLVHVP